MAQWIVLPNFSQLFLSKEFILSLTNNHSLLKEMLVTSFHLAFDEVVRLAWVQSETYPEHSLEVEVIISE